MIVDCADTDTEMSTDPFLEAGIDIPKELPYQTPMVKKKFSIIKRRDSKMNEPSPANSCVRWLSSVRFKYKPGYKSCDQL